MNTPLSLVQELRNIRGGQKHSQADLEGLLAEIREARREWQEQVDQAQHFLRELLGAVSELSGVELPGIAVDPLKDGDGSLRLGFKTLKDRIKNDLEGFASRSASEVAKEVHGRSQIVLEPLEKEMSARMDHLADEFRGKLQTRLESEQNEAANQAKLQTEEMLQSKMNDFAEWIKLMTEGTVSSVPATVQKSLEPHIAEVKDRLKSSFQQHLSMVVMELERTTQSKVEGIQKDVQGLVSGLSERARQTCSESADQVLNEFNGRLSAATQESSKQFEAGTRAYSEDSFNGLKALMGELAAGSKDELQSFAGSHVEEFKQKLRATAQELQEKSSAEIASNVSKASHEALNSSLAQVRQRMDESLEQSKGELKSSMGTMLDDVRKQMDGFALSARDSLSGEATRFSDNLKNLGEELKAAENDRITALVETLSNLSRQTLEGHAQSLKQVAEAQLEEIRRAMGDLQTRMASDYETKLRRSLENERIAAAEHVRKQAEEASAGAVDRIRANSTQVVQDLSGKVNKEVNTATTLLNQWAHQTTTWAESSIKESLESYKRQVGEFTDTLLESQRSTIQSRIGDLQERLEQAAYLLRIPNGDVAAAARREKEPQQA